MSEAIIEPAEPPPSVWLKVAIRVLIFLAIALLTLPACRPADRSGSGVGLESVTTASGIEMVYIPVAGPPGEDHAEELASLWPDLSKPCLGYCRSGARANMLYALLESTE